jgi:hypothetical protein
LEEEEEEEEADQIIKPPHEATRTVQEGVYYANVSKTGIQLIFSVFPSYAPSLQGLTEKAGPTSGFQQRFSNKACGRQTF